MVKQKKKVGAPALYDSPQEMEKRIDEYFEKACQPEYFIDKDGDYILDKFGYPIIKKANKPTINGLARYLGFADRQSLRDYQYRNKNNKEFACVIKKGIGQIEEEVEQQLLTREKVTGQIFWLKCCRKWDDKPKDDEEDIEEKAKAINEQLVNVANLIKNPQPNRKIEDYE